MVLTTSLAFQPATQPAAKTMTCPECGRLVSDRHFRRPDLPRCMSGRKRWTLPRLFELAGLTERGWDDERIARELSRSFGWRVTTGAIDQARWIYRVSGPRAVALSSREVERMLGIPGDNGLVTRWIANGWLDARQGNRMGRGRAWLIDRTALWNFVENPLQWHRWEPEAVTDPALRRHVAAVRGTERRYVPVREAVGILAARGLFVSQSTVAYWVRTGHLESVVEPVSPDGRSAYAEQRRALRLIPIATLATVAPPAMGGASGKSVST